MSFEFRKGVYFELNLFRDCLDDKPRSLDRHVEVLEYSDCSSGFLYSSRVPCDILLDVVETGLMLALIWFSNLDVISTRCPSTS